MLAYGEKATIGFIGPPRTNSTVLHEAFRLAPPGVTWCWSTMGLPEFGQLEFDQALALAELCAKELANRQVSVIVMTGIPLISSKGAPYHEKLERELSDARKKLAMGGGAAANGASAAGVREVGNVKLMARAVEGIEMKDLKSLADDGKKQLGSGVVAIVGVTEDGKAGVVVGVTPDLTSRFNAVNLVRVASEALGGKGGGGRPDMAQAGGPDGAKASAALSAIEKAMAEA